MSVDQHEQPAPLEASTPKQATEVLKRVANRMKTKSAEAEKLHTLAKQRLGGHEAIEQSLLKRRAELEETIRTATAELEHVTGKISQIDPSVVRDLTTTFEAQREQHVAWVEGKALVDERLGAIERAAFDDRIEELVRDGALAERATDIQELLKSEEATIEGIMRLIPEHLRPRTTLVSGGKHRVFILQPREGSETGILLYEDAKLSTYHRLRFKIPGAEDLKSRLFKFPCLCCELYEDKEGEKEESKIVKHRFQAGLAEAAKKAGVRKVFVRNPQKSGSTYQIEGLEFLDGEPELIETVFEGTTLLDSVVPVQ